MAIRSCGFDPRSRYQPKPMIMTDEEKQQILDLINQAKEGKQLAFTKLYNRFKRSITYTIFNIVKNKDVTDDLLSITFCKAFQRIDTYVNNISFEMWLKTIAINASIDYIRHTKKEKNNYYIDDEESKVQLSGSADCSPEETFLFHETNSRVEDAMKKLRFKYRNILNLKIESNLSYKEIATALNLSESQVKSTLNKAREKLKELLN